MNIQQTAHLLNTNQMLRKKRWYPEIPLSHASCQPARDHTNEHQQHLQDSIEESEDEEANNTIVTGNVCTFSYIQPVYKHLTCSFHSLLAQGHSHVSQLQYYAYYLHTRVTTIHHSGRLFQEWLVDAFAQIENNRLQYRRLNQDKLRSELYNGLQDALADGTDLNEIGQRIILPSTFIGSPHHMIQQYQDAMAIVSHTSNPDIFITFTANPQWDEIREAILRHHTPQDQPGIISCVFKLKLNALCKDLFDNHVLGKAPASPASEVAIT